MMAPFGMVLPPVEELRRKVLRSVVLLGLVRVAKMVPVVLVPGPVPGAARMGLPCILNCRTGRLTKSPSAGSPPAR